MKSGGYLTLGDALAAASGRPVGFDFLRIGLSICVLASHTIGVAEGSDVTFALLHSPFRPLLAGIMPVFFPVRCPAMQLHSSSPDCMVNPYLGIVEIRTLVGIGLAVKNNLHFFP